MSFKSLLSFMLGAISMGIGIYSIKVDGRSGVWFCGVLIVGLIIAEISCYLIHDYKRREFYENNTVYKS